MSQGPESQATPAPEPGAISSPQTPIPVHHDASRVFSNTLLMLFGALLASGGYFLARVYAPPRPPGEVTGPAFGGVQPDEFKALVARVDVMHSQADQASKKGDAPSGPGPEYTKLRDQVSDLARAVGDVPPRFEVLEKRIESETKAQSNATSPRLDALDKRVADLAQAVDTVKVDASAKVAAPSPAPAPAPSPAPAPAPTPGPGDRSIAQAVDLFKEGKYAEAVTAFKRLQSTAADDARVWYYSALANGLATRQWRGETERLVLAGLDREKAGTPPTAEIDASFSGLTAANGKDWLAGYRKRIAPR